MKRLLLLLGLFIPLLATAVTSDETGRPVIGRYSLEAGSISVIDTYLTEIRYKGFSTALRGNWQKAFTRRPETFAMGFDASIEGGRLFNPAHNIIMLQTGASFGWGAWWRHRLTPFFSLQAGAAAAGNVGVLYLTANSNNPVSIKADISMSLTAGFQWKLKAGRLPLLVSEKVSLPSLGVFFSPEYGEPYYEIYIGNHRNLAHCAWWGNHFCISEMIDICLDLGRTAVSIGYRFDARTSWINNLNTQIMRHSLVVGIIPGGLHMQKQRKHPTTEITPFP